MRSFPLQLKNSQPVDIVNPFAKFISSKHGPDAFKATQNTLQTMQNIRNSFDFTKNTAQIHNDFRLCGELEEQLVQYLKYATLIDQYFKNEFADPRGVKIPFAWSDSFQPKKNIKAVSHSKYELIGVLYNLAVTYYIDGTIASSSIKDEDKLKALGKLRICLWCINEIKQAMPTILVNPQDLPSDIDLTFINLLYNYVTGLCYSILLEIAEKDTKKYGPERLASINKAAAKHFKVALDICDATGKSSSIPDVFRKSINAALIFYAASHRTNAYYQQARHHLVLQQDEDRVREGHMGLASSNLRQAYNVINAYLGDKKMMDILNPQQKTDLAKLGQTIKAEYEQVSFKNKNIFQDREYPPEQLPEIQDETMIIGPLEPKEWKNKLEDEKNFEWFMSPELKAVKREFFQEIDGRKAELETNLKNANNLRNKYYAEGYINYLIGLDANGGKKNELPPQIKTGLERFHKNGGSTNYDKIRGHINQSSQNCKTQVDEIKSAMNKERQDDEEMRQKFPKAWNRPHSEAINQDNIIKLKDLEQKYYIALKADEEVNQKYTKVKDWITKLSVPQDQVLQMLNLTSDTDFYNQNQDKIQSLQKQHQELNKLIELEPTKEAIKNIVENYKKKNLLKEYQELAALNPQDRKEAINKMLKPLEEELSKVNKGIQDSYPILDQMVRNAKAMNENRSNSNQSAIRILEDISQATNLINEVYDDLIQGSEFYSNLSYYLSELQRTVSDFCIAREIDRQTRVQDLEANKNYQQFNNQKPYFTEENMKFAQGTSTYIPANQLNKGPQQNSQQTNQQQNMQSQQQNMQNQHSTQSNVFNVPTNQKLVPQTQQHVQPSQHLGYPNQQPGYQGGLPQGYQGGFQQQGGFSIQGGFPQQGFPQQGGFQQQGYSQQGGFQQQGGFNMQGGFPQQGFSQQGGFQQGYPQQSQGYSQQQPQQKQQSQQQQQQQQQQNKGPFAGFGFAESTYVPNPNQKK